MKIEILGAEMADTDKDNDTRTAQRARDEQESVVGVLLSRLMALLGRENRFASEQQEAAPNAPVGINYEQKQPPPPEFKLGPIVTLDMVDGSETNPAVSAPLPVVQVSTPSVATKPDYAAMGDAELLQALKAKGDERDNVLAQNPKLAERLLDMPAVQQAMAKVAKDMPLDMQKKDLTETGRIYGFVLDDAIANARSNPAMAARDPDRMDDQQLMAWMRDDKNQKDVSAWLAASAKNADRVFNNSEFQSALAARSAGDNGERTPEQLAAYQTMGVAYKSLDADRAHTMLRAGINPLGLDMGKPILSIPSIDPDTRQYTMVQGYVETDKDGKNPRLQVTGAKIGDTFTAMDLPYDIALSADGKPLPESKYKDAVQVARGQVAAQDAYKEKMAGAISEAEDKLRDSIANAQKESKERMRVTPYGSTQDNDRAADLQRQIDKEKEEAEKKQQQPSESDFRGKPDVMAEATKAGKGAVAVMGDDLRVTDFGKGGASGQDTNRVAIVGTGKQVGSTAQGVNG